MPTNDAYVPTIYPIPDEYTANAIMYGSAYTFYVSSKYYWDQVQDQLEHDIEGLKRKIIDREFAAYVMERGRHMIFASTPPTNRPDEIRDLWTLREIIRKGSALHLLEMRRMENLMWSEMRGVSEYASQVAAGGITEDQWKAATMGQIVPIDFETVRALRDREPDMARKEAEEYLDEVAQMNRLREQELEFRRDYDEWREESGFGPAATVDIPDEMCADADSESERGPDDWDEDGGDAEEYEGSLSPNIRILKDVGVTGSDDEDGDGNGDEDADGCAHEYTSLLDRNLLAIVRWAAYDPLIETLVAMSGGETDGRADPALQGLRDRPQQRLPRPPALLQPRRLPRWIPEIVRALPQPGVPREPALEF